VKKLWGGMMEATHSAPAARPATIQIGARWRLLVIER